MTNVLCPFFSFMNIYCLQKSISKNRCYFGVVNELLYWNFTYIVKLIKKMHWFEILHNSVLVYKALSTNICIWTYCLFIHKNSVKFTSWDIHNRTCIICLVCMAGCKHWFHTTLPHTSVTVSLKQLSLHVYGTQKVV